jgi:hypothetical protein
MDGPHKSLPRIRPARRIMLQQLELRIDDQFQAWYWVKLALFGLI